MHKTCDYLDEWEDDEYSGSELVEDDEYYRE